MNSLSSNYKMWILGYYVVLLIAFFILMQPETKLSMLLRASFLGLIILPTIFYINILPAVLLLFCGADNASFLPILPSNDLYYLFIVSALYIFYKEKTNIIIDSFVILTYFIILSALHLFYPPITWIIIAIMLCDMIKTKNDLEILFYMFMMLSIFLSILFIVHRNEFLLIYGTENFERTRWINPNVYGAVIAAGGTQAVAYLIGILKFRKFLFPNILSIGTIALSFTVLIMNASRGSILAFLLPTLSMILFSKTKSHTKFLVITISCILVFLLYKYNVYDLVFYRIRSDETGGTGGRTNIVLMKLNMFLSTANPINLIFGIGQEACVNLGRYISTHNDFITSFIAYGLLGLCLFIYIIYYPIKKASKEKKTAIISLFLYLLVECCVLEPFFRGYFVETMFYFFIFKYSLINDIETDRYLLEEGV